MITQFLVDTSAAVRLVRNTHIQGLWRQQLIAGTIGISSTIELEFLRGVHGKTEYQRNVLLLETYFTWIVTPDDVFRRALQVQELLADRSTHHGPSAVDLLVAATAELSKLSLLHYDRDFETIAAVTRQPLTWLATSGTID